MYKCLFKNRKEEMKIYQVKYYQSLTLKKKKTIKALKIFLPYGRWYNRKYKFRGKTVLDFGSSIKSDFFKKFVQDNKGNDNNYYGFDLDRKTIKWLKENNYYYDFYKDNKLEGRFDVINASQVYEHLTLDERELFIRRSYKLLKKKGMLLVDFPYINNLNIIEFFHGDRTHKPVACEDEANYITNFGFKCRVYIGGYTWPYQSLLRNIWSFIWNVLLGYYPFHLTLVEAVKK